MHLHAALKELVHKLVYGGVIMFREIGAFDAKEKLSELLRELSQGQRYTITVRGKPVADLIPTVLE